MTKERHALIKALRKCADDLESGTCPAAALVFVNAEQGVRYAWQGEAVAEISMLASGEIEMLASGTHVLSEMILKKLSERMTSE
jgi:hypothetical protein